MAAVPRTATYPCLVRPHGCTILQIMHQGSLSLSVDCAALSG